MELDFGTGMDAMVKNSQTKSVTHRQFSGFGTSTLSCVTALTAGAFFGQMFVVWVSLAGTDPVATAMLIAGVTSGILGGLLAIRRLSRVLSARMHQTAALILTAICVLLSWAFPECLRRALVLGSEFSGNSLAASASSGAELLAMVPAGFLTGKLLAAGLLWMYCIRASCSSSEARGNSLAADRWGDPQWFLWAAVGVNLLLVHAYWAIPLAMTVSVLITGTLVIRMMVSESENRSAGISEPQPQPGMHPEFEEHSVSISLLTSGAGSGILFIAVGRLMNQLMPGSVPLTLMSLLHLTVVLFLATRRPVMRLLSEPGQQIAALALLTGLPWMFSWLTDTNLTLRTSVGHPLLLLLLQGLQCGIFLSAAALPMLRCRLPLAGSFVTGQMTHTATMTSAFGHSINVRLMTPSAGIGCCVGMLVAIGLVSQSVSPVALLSVGLALEVARAFVEQLTGLWFRRSFTTEAVVSKTHLQMSDSSLSVGTRWKAATAAVCLLCSVSVLFSSPDTSRSVQLLFTGRSLEAIRRGVDPDLIPQSDSSRCIASKWTSTGEIQVWRRSGEVFEFRRNGISLGKVSRDPDLTPQPVEEILPAILPLVMHPSPGRVLILGDDTGICLRVCREFPLQRVVAVRSDAESTQLATDYTWNNETQRPQDDERVTLRHQSAADAIQHRPEVPFDVMLTSLPPATTTSGLFGYTAEFYAMAHRQLTDTGVFCQRFRLQDLGPDTLMQLMATAMTSFQHVIAIQTVPGEVVLIAGSAAESLPGKQVLTRLQQDFIRRQTGTAAWDWSQAALLPVLDASDATGIFSHIKPPHRNTAANGYFAMSLPFEVQRRVNRAAELQAAFTPHQLQLAEMIAPAEAHHEIRRRQSAMAQQIEILAGMPDEPWTYRKSLRMELQRNPRPPRDVVRDGTVERVAHPADQMRQNYFVQLGAAVQRVKSGDNSYDAFRSLTDFTVPYEPLISLFAFYELVRLHEAAQHPAPAEEYRHRQHTVFFTDPSDASVRPVIFAMQHLMDHPEVLPSDEERYDQINSLIQKLIERWEARTAWQPRSAKRVQDDVDQSVAVSNRAMEKMEEWSAAANVSPKELIFRRRFISEALIVPLRDYRDQVLAHLLRERPPEPAAEDDADSLPLVVEQPSQVNTN
jgi:spermidine synthase